MFVILQKVQMGMVGFSLLRTPVKIGSSKLGMLEYRDFAPLQIQLRSLSFLHLTDVPLELLTFFQLRTKLHILVAYIYDYYGLYLTIIPHSTQLRRRSGCSTLRPPSTTTTLSHTASTWHLSTKTSITKLLSYAWGDVTPVMLVNLEGGEVLITKNLHSALSHLRYHDQQRILWADA